ncbi:MAG: sce7726 family protein [Nitrospirae bacterium]|nr:sce7726 family protein [Nitrospirota bacterium]
MKSIALGDSEIRSVLRARLSQKHGQQSRIVIIEELGLCRGQVRVDLSVVNGLLHGYEIKSDRDSFRRLRGQVELYGKVLDRATLVVGERHLDEALDNVPEWWGILLAHQSAKGLQLKTMRSPRSNPKKDPRALVELLWLDDALALLEKRDAARGFRGKARWIVWDRVCEICSLNEIARAVRIQLKARAKKRVPV